MRFHAPHLLALLTALGGVVGAGPAAAWAHRDPEPDWTYRPIAADQLSYNADVLVSSAGHVAVGYAEVGSFVNVARLDANGLFAKATADANYRAFSASFGMNDFGEVHYVATAYPAYGPPYACIGEMTGLYTGQTVDPRHILYGPVLALSPQGVPGIVSAGGWDGGFYEEFNVKTGQWDRTDMPEPYGRWRGIYSRYRSLCIDDLGRAASAEFAGDRSLRVNRQGSAGDWSMTTIGDVNPYASVSIAAGPSGITCAYVSNTDGLMFAHPGSAAEIVTSRTDLYLRGRGLAFDPNGDPWLVAGNETGSEVRLYHRLPDGTWTSERLGVEGYAGANLAFDANGHPYVLAFGQHVTLLTTGLGAGVGGDFDGDNLATPADVDRLFDNRGTYNLMYDIDGDGDVDDPDANALVTEVLGTWMGDTDLDGQVDLADFGRLATHYGQEGDWGWLDGDTNGDGAVDLVDFGRLATHYGNGVLPTAPQPDIPEPATLALLAVGGACLRRRRTSPSRR